MPHHDQQIRLALLIDADNAQADRIEEIVSEALKKGVVSVRRAYGDWTTARLSGWKNFLHRLAIQPIQQFSYTSGKNSTDSALIIDAMDLLYAGNLDGYCIVSSDSDFTRLATRLRESGKVVYGFGERKTPNPFIAACDQFFYVENLATSAQPVDEVEQGNIPPKTTNELKGDTKLVGAIRSAIDAYADDEGWAYLGAIGNQVIKEIPEFNPKNYGYAKLKELMENIKLFELKDVVAKDGMTKSVYIRDQRPK
jgi:uncharacterized LabA/DUF88 family protein